jgi:vacuolar-type H+-ATPase subunit H
MAHKSSKPKIRDGLYVLLQEEEKNYLEVLKAEKRANEEIEKEIKSIEKEREEFWEEMKKYKESLIKKGLLIIEKECEEIEKRGKERAKELIDKIPQYSKKAIKIFEDIILSKGE